MWPRRVSASASARRAASAAARAALCAVWLCGPALVSEAKGAPPASALREQDVRRAEQVLAKLRLLEAAGEGRPGAPEFRSVTRKLYPGLFVSVAELRPSDLKTDLDTAVFLYEEAGRAWAAAGGAAADCGRERPDIYQPLCLELRGGTVRQLLLSKARLHASWAEAAVRDYKGEVDAEAARSLSRMRAARANDLLIAARVAGALRSLEGGVEIPRTDADDLEDAALSNAYPAGAGGEPAEAVERAGELLRWMPRSPAYYSLHVAWRSYRDALFWYQKVRRSRMMVVSAKGFEPDPLEDLGRDQGRVSRAAAANWRSGARYTRLAEQSLPAAAQ